jgi:hypothetical protein
MTKPVAREILRIREGSRWPKELRIAKGATASDELATIFAAERGVRRSRQSGPVPDHAWTASRHSVLVGAYNTKACRRRGRHETIFGSPRFYVTREAGYRGRRRPLVCDHRHGARRARGNSICSERSLHATACRYARARDHVVTYRRHDGLPADLSVAFVQISRRTRQVDTAMNSSSWAAGSWRTRTHRIWCGGDDEIIGRLTLP